MNTIKSETIAAIATARGTAGIAVIRVSGDSAFEVCENVFFVKNRAFADIAANHAVFGKIRSKGGDVIDEGIAVKFFAPKSYTGENTVEISCHGSMYTANTVLKAIINSGARLAKAGEFTKRAYLNGKISLTGAEAVGRLIEASNATGAKVALAQSRGGLSKVIGKISGEIKQILSEVYVYIDYPDEDLTEMTPDIMLSRLEDIKCELVKLRNSYSAGKIISGGIDTAIIGKPNTGKSTLLNMLSARDVAIVHNTAGTTRDIIESHVNIGHFRLNLFDTAGIHGATDEVENIGISRAISKIDECSLIIGVFDMTGTIDKDDLKIAEILRERKFQGKNIIALINKYDADTGLGGEYADYLREFEPSMISAKENTTPEKSLSACDIISEKLDTIYNLGAYNLDAGEILTEERQHFEICEAADAVNRAIFALQSGHTQDIAGLDLELAAASLDRCDSKSLSEDIVDRIFKNFCVGK